ncbi:MAG: hypothetical protein IJR07_10360 [Bacteroidaceae bacterium]|nr:hypothetical protein [Bacteroidaceae bacterium]
MKKIVILMMLATMCLRAIADEGLQPGQAVAVSENCYGTVVPETLDKLAEYISNENFEMFSTFFKFGYATYLDKGMRATVVKVQDNKALVRLENLTHWWVLTDDLQNLISPLKEIGSRSRPLTSIDALPLSNTVIVKT